MAKVYSWEITKSNVYAYIIDPNDIEGMGVYIGPEIYGNDLNKVVNWASSCSNEQYKIQFNKIKSKCEELGYAVIFEDVEIYLNVKASRENLRGPAGRGISYIRLIESDDTTRKNTYAIYYDDNTYDTIEIQNGADGKDGINGEPGINGFDGVSSKFIMIYSVGIEKDGNIIPPEQPTGGTYNFITNKIEFNVGEQNLEEQGWGTDNNLNGVIYMSSRTFTSSNLSTDNEWSIPVRISGEQGIPGKDGSSIEFIYNLTNQEPNVLNLESPNESGYVPIVDGWTGSPSGVDENNTKEWCSIRTYNNDKNEWGEWQKATIWSNYGVNGQDGDGVQYIYYRTMNSTPPNNPTPYNYIENEDYQNVENEWFPSKNIVYNNIYNELVKFDSDWEDNPKGVDINYQYEWVVSRKYRKNNSNKKNWTSFSNPSLWAKFGVDGKNATSIKKIYALSKNTDVAPPLNKEDITGGSIWGTGFPTGYIVGENVVWGAEAEVWSHNYDFVKSYKVVSTKDNNGNIIPPSDANEENTKDVDTLPTEENTSYTYLRYDYEYYKWKGEYCNPFLVTGLKGDNGNPTNYTTYVFAYGYKDFTPNSPNGETPENPGSSLDENNNTVEWVDFPDTSDGKIDNTTDEAGNTRRWYQCCGSVDGKNNKILQWGKVYPLNGIDGSNGSYTEFRFAITTGTTKPYLDQYDDENNIIREPELNDDSSKGWFTTSEDMIIPTGGAMWQIWATIDSVTNNVKGEWNGPVRISGEQGEQGTPGVSQNQMYSLGTVEVCFANDAENNLPINNAIHNRWLYSDEIPDTNIIHVLNYSDISNFLNKENLGRIICDDGNKKYYLIHRRGNIERFGVLNLNSYEGEDLYVWTIQGSDKYNENNILEGVSWCKPFKLQGVKGPAGSRGIPGVSQNQMYSLGTAEVCFGIFKETYIPEILHNEYRWLYSDEIPDTNIIKVTNLTFEQIKQQYANKENLGRVIENTTTEGNIKTNYLIVLSNSLYDCEEINNNVDYLYIWCIQGKDIYGKDNNGDDIITGVSWCKPFKLQGVNGLPGKDGSKGQITYPMGVYNSNEVYTTTSKKAPYVIDSNDGLYYVLNKEMTWVGKLPADYKTIVIHPNDADNDAYSCDISKIPTNYEGDYIRVTQAAWKSAMYFKWNGNKYIMASKFKYSSDGSGGESTWLTEQGSGNTPSVDYTNNSANGTNCWERFESFDALYASVAIVENGTIGSAVFNGEYMFSQQGINSEGVYSDSYEKFNNREPYNETNEFRPNICIDFKKGDMWTSQGNINFNSSGITLSGDLSVKGFFKRLKTEITASNYNDYLSENNEYEYLDVNKTGTYVHIKSLPNGKTQVNLPYHKMPYRNNFTNGIIIDKKGIELMRQIYGSEIIIINDTSLDLSIGARGPHSGNTEPSGVWYLPKGCVEIYEMTFQPFNLEYNNDFVNMEAYAWTKSTNENTLSGGNMTNNNVVDLIPSFNVDNGTIK